MNKPWPDKGATVSFEAMAEPVVDAIRKLYALERKKVNGIEWTGLDIGKSMQATCFSPDQNLTKEALKYHADQGRDPLDIAVGIAIQMGIEQGRRMACKDMKSKMERLDLYLQGLNRSYKDLIQ